MRSGLTLFLGSAMLLALGSCSHQPSDPSGATLQVNLTTPNTDDGALLLTISGGPVDSLEAPGYNVYSHRSDPRTLQVILTGSIKSGTIARIMVPDERQVAQYSATVNQAAAKASYQQRDPGNYRLTLEP